MIIECSLGVLEDSRGQGRSPVGGSFDPTCPVPINRVLFSWNSTHNCFKWGLYLLWHPHSRPFPLHVTLCSPHCLWSVGLQVSIAHPVRTLVRNTLTSSSPQTMWATRSPNFSKMSLAKISHRCLMDKPSGCFVSFLLDSFWYEVTLFCTLLLEMLFFLGLWSINLSYSPPTRKEI